MVSTGKTGGQSPLQRQHGYRAIERATGVLIYFANPYHSWERGTNENTNGLIRQYLPKRMSMKGLTHAQCNLVSRKLNDRPRKRLGFLSPLERLEQSRHFRLLLGTPLGPTN